MRKPEHWYEYLVSADATVDGQRYANDALGLVWLSLLLRSRHMWLRRIGVIMIVISGIDGGYKIAKNYKNYIALPDVRPLAEMLYQIPWIILGLVSLRWLRDPPRFGAQKN